MADYPKVAEYRDHKDAPWSKREVLWSATSNRISSRLIEFVHISEGYEIAGSMKRWTDECYGVLFEFENAIHGRRLKNQADAIALFNAWTAKED